MLREENKVTPPTPIKREEDNNIPGDNSKKSEFEMDGMIHQDSIIQIKPTADAEYNNNINRMDIVVERKNAETIKNVPSIKNRMKQFIRYFPGRPSLNLLGERHSGTNWMSNHLLNCFNDTVDFFIGYRYVIHTLKKQK